MGPGAEHALRAPRRDELPQLCALLQAAFAGQIGALRYVPPVLGFLMQSGGESDVDSIVLVEDTELRGLIVRSPREVRWGGQALRCLHLGPVAVHPAHQGRGLGRALLDAAARSAQEAGFDLLHLTVLDGGGAERLYARAGFRVVRTSRPWLRSLPSSYGRPLIASAWPSAWPAAPEDPRVVQEAHTLPARVPDMLHPRLLRARGGAALTLRWPVQQAQGRWAWSTQIIALEGPSPALLDTLTAQAVDDQSVALWGMAERAAGLPGFEEGGPSSAHMLRGLSPRGHEAAEQAQAYRAFGPAG
ncbi:MAG: GNAT family N-acetyltransferase [Alphaproteobacteria bacterium]|nr:GNAT family N-acetyltransferase [Alphaproteobacteria bacterium]MCB9792570.1 GNAT family N-acetyltransferase [Alphaproteobacteria bacterium]